MTDKEWDAFIAERVNEWCRISEDFRGTLGLLEFVRMDKFEYSAWYLTGQVSSRAKEAWSV